MNMNFALASKLLGKPLYLSAAHGAFIQTALQRGQLASAGHDMSASKLIGTLDHRSRYRVADGIAIVSVQGILVDRGAWLGDLGGLATSYEGLAAQMSRIAEDTAIHAVILDIDSHGGMVAGLYDLTALIAEIDKRKPVYALAANMAASAAYALACPAREVFVTRTGEVGSIGIIQIHQSFGRLLENAGIETTIICEPAAKADGNPFHPLSHGARAEFSSAISDAYRMLIAHVAQCRKLSKQDVSATQARMFTGAQAVKAGFADGVMSVHELLDYVRSKRSRRREPQQKSEQKSQPAKTTDAAAEAARREMRSAFKQCRQAEMQQRSQNLAAIFDTSTARLGVRKQ